MGAPSTQGGIQDSLPQSASSISSPNGLSVVSGQQGEIPSSPGGGKPDAGEGSNRKSTRNQPGLLQQAFPGSQSLRDMETRSRCVTSQHLCDQNKVLHGNHPVCPRFDPTRRLDGDNGHEGRLLSCSNSRGLQEVPQVLFQRGSIPVQGPVFRPEHGTTGLHQGSGSPGGYSPSSRIPDNPISGRLVDNRPVEGTSVEGERVRSESGVRIGDCDQFRKILFSAKTNNRVFRYADRRRSFLGFSLQETDRLRSLNLSRISVLYRKASQILAKLAGSHVLSREVHSGRSSENETPTISPKPLLGQRVSEDSGPHSGGLKEQPLMVDGHSKVNWGASTSKEEPRPILVFRRLSRGMGGDHRRKTSGRKMVSFRETTPYQFSGTKSNLVSPKRSAALGSGQNSSSICRQHNSSGILNKTGGNQVLVTFPISTGNISLARREQGDSNAAIHSGRKEHSGRFPEQEGTDTSKRMDVTSGRLPGSLEVVGSSHGGPICHEPHQKATSIHVSTRGPHGHSDRFHVAKLVQHGRLCIPTVRHDPQGPQQISVQHQLQNNSHSPLVASERMVSGTPISNIGTSSSIATQTRSAEPTFSKGKTQKSPHSTTCRMETLQRLTKFKDLSKKVSKAIYESRKPSTNVLYQKRWATFVQWCRAHKVSASKPSINSICEFFIYLFEEKKLVVSTIRCFRSTLHSVLRHTGLKINKNDDITEVIRSLKLRSPVTNPRIVHWNLDVLLKFLCGEKFEPIRECSILNLTRKTFILLALALSKRVSELQALSRTVGFCKEGALVSLALDFRAKNDFKCKGLARNFLIKELSSLVGQEEEALLCPVRALKAYLERTKPLIDNNVSRLFVSPRFPKNHASKNALTSMTKAVIREAHESLRPDLLPILKVKIHELRGVSTSLAFKKNLSLQKVMEAAQWRCHSVFASHYLKDISFDYDDCRTLGPLLVAGSVIT